MGSESGEKRRFGIELKYAAEQVADPIKLTIKENHGRVKKNQSQNFSTGTGELIETLWRMSCVAEQVRPRVIDGPWNLLFRKIPHEL